MSSERNAQIVLERAAGCTYSHIAKKHGISTQRARQIATLPSYRERRNEDLLRLLGIEPVPADLAMSARVINALPQYGHIEDFTGMTRRECLRRSRNLGKKSLQELEQFLHRHGLKFKPEICTRCGASHD